MVVQCTTKMVVVHSCRRKQVISCCTKLEQISGNRFADTSIECFSHQSHDNMTYNIYPVIAFCFASLVPRPPPAFCSSVAFSIIHGSGRAVENGNTSHVNDA